MKWIIWTIGGVLAVLWTGASALVAWVVEWAGSALQQAGSATSPVLPMQELPTWLSGWIEPGAWAAIVQAIQQTLGAVQAVLPAVGTATGWLGPLVWILWGLGMVALLVVAAGSHWLVARRISTQFAFN